MITIEKSAFREKILDACIAQKQSSIDDFKVRMKSLLDTEGLGNEEEYDNNELSQRGQASDEVNSLNHALSAANEEMSVLRQLKSAIRTTHNKVEPGAVVITNKARFIICVGIQQVAVDGERFIALSAKSPLYLAMRGLPTKSKFYYNGAGYRINDVF